MTLNTSTCWQGRAQVLIPLALVSLLVGLALVLLFSAPSQGKPLVNEHQISKDGVENLDPFVIEDSQGYLDMAWRVVEGNNSYGDIWFSRSLDGSSWSEPLQVTSYAGKDSRPILTEGDDGKLYLTFSSNRDTQGQGQSWDVYLTTSSDWGQTWDAPSYVAGKYPHGEGPEGIVVDGNTIWIAYHEAYGNDIIQYIIKSTDGGINWRSPVKVTGASLLNSAPLLQDSEGNLFMALSKKSTEKVHIFTSPTGDSWSEISSQGFHLIPNKMAFIQDSNGDYWLAFWDEPYGDRELFITKSSDLMTWEPVNRLTYQAGEDWNPNLVERDSGKLNIFWESDRNGDRQLFMGEVNFKRLDLSFEQPKVIVDENGKHYMVMSAMMDPETQDRDIWFTSSIDGQDWSEPAQVAASVKRDSSPTLTIDEEGVLYLAFSSNRDTIGQGQSWDVYLTKSFDDGQTWTTPAYVAGTYPEGNGPADIQFFPDGRLLITFNEMPNSYTNHPYSIVSDDKGDTWSSRSKITPLNIQNRGGTIIDDGGRAVMGVRERANTRFHIYSSLNGLVWSEETVLDWGVEITDPDLFQDENGLYWFIWQLPVNNGEIWYTTSSNLKDWADPEFAVGTAWSDNKPNLFSKLGSSQSRAAWTSDWDGDWEIRFIDLDPPVDLKLRSPSPNIYFVSGGEQVTFELTAEAVGGQVHNASLWVAAGGQGLQARLSPSVASLAEGSNTTFTVTFTAPPVDNFSTEFRVWVEVRSDEASSNPQQLLIIYDAGEAPEAGGLPSVGAPGIVAATALAGVVATSFRRRQPQGP